MALQTRRHSWVYGLCSCRFILLGRVDVEISFPHILKSLILPPSRGLFFIFMDLRIPFVIQGFEKYLIFCQDTGFNGA